MLSAYTKNLEYIDISKWCTVIHPNYDESYVVGYSTSAQKWCLPKKEGSKQPVSFELADCPLPVLAKNSNFTGIKNYNSCVVWIDLDTNKIYAGGEDITKDYLKIQALFKGLGVKWSQIKCKNFINCPAENKYVWINAWYEAYRVAHPSFDTLVPTPSLFDKIKKAQAQANVYAWILKNGVCTKQPVPKEGVAIASAPTKTIGELLNVYTTTGSF